MKDLKQKDINHVLVLCESASDRGALAHSAATLCRQMGADLLLLTVIYNPFGVQGLSFPRPSLRRDYQELLEKSRNALLAIIMQEKVQGIAMQELVREGKPLKELLAVIRERNIDLLILPAQSQTWLESLLTGGYNKTVLRKMPCSVLFLKTEPVAIEEEEEQEDGEEMEAA